MIFVFIIIDFNYKDPTQKSGYFHSNKENMIKFVTPDIEVSLKK